MAKSIKFACPTSGRETQWRSVCKRRSSINRNVERKAGRNPLASAMGSSLSRLQPP
jgi:hypothetical protein